MKNNIIKWAKKVAITLGALYLVILLVRIPSWWNEQKTEEQIIKIHATKLALDDVIGKNLPPDPGAEADKTIEGIDANENGIRDDVELAIFKEYPNSAKTEMPLLQYALALQLQMTMPLVNTDTVTATVEDTENNANICLWTLSVRPDISTIRPEDDDNPNSPLKKFSREQDFYEKFVEDRQLNTKQRKDYLEAFINDNLKDFSLNPSSGCDIDPSSLLN